MTVRNGRTYFLVLAIAFGIVRTTPCLAQKGKAAPERSVTERVTGLKASAKAAMIDLRFKEALDLYREAYSLVADPALLYNQARALQAMDEHADAVVLLERFEREAPPDLKAKVPDLHTLIRESRARVTALTVVVSVPGAQVVVRGRVVGTSPLQNAVGVNAGPAEIVVRADGYVPYEERVELQGGSARTVDVQLVPKANEGTLTIRTNVVGARVRLDGAPIGDSASIVVPTGRHTLQGEADGYVPSETSVDIVRGARKEVVLELKAKPGILTKWWFWTGVGIVVAAGVGTVFAITTERSADVGTIAPGQLATPLRF
jgi:hypothetical protein